MKRRPKTPAIEGLGDFVIDRGCSVARLVITGLALAIPWLLCLAMGIKGKNKYIRFGLGAVPIFMIGMIFSSWLMISNPASFAVDAFGTAQGLLNAHKDVKEFIIKRMPDGTPHIVQHYGLDHAVNMAGNATGLKQTTPADKAKAVFIAPLQWLKGLAGVVL
jgi:hypothetical protein